LLDLPLQLDGLLLGQLLLASERLEVRLLDSPEGCLLELRLEGLHLVFQVLDPLALVVAQSEVLVLRLEFGDLLREVVDLFLDVLQLLLQLLSLNHGVPPHLIDFSLFALRLSEEDALLLKLQFPLILRLTEPQIVLLGSSPRICQVNLLDEFLSLHLVEVALVDRVPQLLLQPLGRLRSIQTLPSHSLVVEVLLLQLGLQVEDFLAGICLLGFQVLDKGLRVFQVLGQSPLLVGGGLQVRGLHERVFTLICLNEAVLLLNIFLNS